MVRNKSFLGRIIFPWSWDPFSWSSLALTVPNTVVCFWRRRLMSPILFPWCGRFSDDRYSSVFHPDFWKIISFFIMRQPWPNSISGPVSSRIREVASLLILLVHPGAQILINLVEWSERNVLTSEYRFGGTFAFYLRVSICIAAKTFCSNLRGRIFIVFSRIRFWVYSFLAECVFSVMLARNIPFNLNLSLVTDLAFSFVLNRVGFWSFFHVCKFTTVKSLPESICSRILLPRICVGTYFQLLPPSILMVCMYSNFLLKCEDLWPLISQLKFFRFLWSQSLCQYKLPHLWYALLGTFSRFLGLLDVFSGLLVLRVASELLVCVCVILFFHEEGIKNIC